MRILGFASACQRVLGAFANELGTRQIKSDGPLPVRFHLAKSAHEARPEVRGELEVANGLRRGMACARERRVASTSIQLVGVPRVFARGSA